MKMLEINSIFDDRFKITGVIGKGGMGTVYLASELQDQSMWAVKEQLITDANRKLLVSEAELLAKLTHPALPRLRYGKENGGYLYLVMDYVDGSTLEDIIQSGRKPNEKTIIGWFIQACQVLEYLHGLETPVVYRDLKPSNIMIDRRSGNIKIIDFGIAQEYSGQKADVEVAALTRGYAAPEQYDSRYHLDVRTDIYALGVTIHYLVTGKDPNQPPFHFRPVRKLAPGASYAIEKILKKCLQPNPDKRYANVALLLSDLAHMDSLEKDIRERLRWRRILVTALTAAVAVVALIVYTMNRDAREKEILDYYDYFIRAEEAGSFDDAMEILRQAVNSNPDNPEAYVEIARLYGRYGRYEEELQYIQKEIIARFPDIYENEDFLELVEELDAISH